MPPAIKIKPPMQITASAANLEPESKEMFPVMSLPAGTDTGYEKG